MRLLLPLLLGGLLAASGGAATLQAASITVAAASNFVLALPALQAAFTAEHPETEVVLTTGATGSLIAQIERGAPYDVLLAADLDYPRGLAARGHAEADTLVAFARGRLVWWTMRPLAAETALADALHDPALRRIAIAQPDHAPYGVAAREVLQHLGRWDDLQPRLVRGENISQTAQFVESGNADGGFVSLSLVQAPRLAGRGTWIEVPAALYSPLDHGAIVTRRGAANPASAVFINWLQSAAARDLLLRFGYAVPPHSP